MRIWDELRPWMAELTLNAAAKWLPRMALGMPCQVPVMQGGAVVGACRSGAVSQCDACERTCCLQHARIDHLGDAICYVCVAEKVQQTRRQASGRTDERRAPKSADHDEKWARRKLGVTKDASWAEIRTAYKQQSAKWHPDRHRTAGAKEKAEERFKDVQRAYQVLQKLHEDAA